jgi:hypothetical protein
VPDRIAILQRLAAVKLLFPNLAPGYTALTLALMALSILARPTATQGQVPGRVEPHYWRQQVFFVPYQPNLQDPRANKIDKVQLLLSRDGGQQWAVLQEAEPHVRGFSYHAAADGEYAFALRMADKRGNYWPEQITQPLLRVVVDTRAPTLDLTASLDNTGQVIIRYEARDDRLKPETLRLEAQADDGPWQRLAFGPPEVSQADRLLGQLAWRPPTAGRGLKIRATIDDAAGNPGTATTDASLVGPVLDPAAGPQLAPPNFGRAPPEAQAARTYEPTRSGVEWPSNNSLSSTREPAPAPSGAAAYDPFALRRDVASASTGPSGDGRTVAQFAADGAAPSLLSPDRERGAAPAAVGGDAWVSRGASASVGDGASNSTTSASAQIGTAEAVAAAGDGGTPWVNSLTIDVDYDIQTAGPWGVSKVTLWGTRDGGREWVSLGVDEDNRSPMRVTVPGEGIFGFRIVVDGGNGASTPPPRAGDQPEMAVGVDLAPPRAQLRGAELGDGALVGHLVVRWSADDDRLAARPVGLFYSATAEGPWTTIATDLENVGEYAWRLGRDVPPRVFLRLEVRDAAGNVAVQQTQAAVDLNLPRPTGRLRSVRPIEAAPGRYRTAAGTRSVEG